LRSPTRNRCGGHRPLSTLSSSEELKSRTGGGRNARATRVRAGARNSGIPQRLTLMNRQLAAGSAAIIQRDQELSRFRCTHSPPHPTPPQPKKLPSLCRTCGRCAFPVDARGNLRTNFGPSLPQIPRLPNSCQAPKSPHFPLTRTIHSRYKSHSMSTSPPPT